MIRIVGTVFAALAGLAFGSFLNVCLSRWPEGESVVKPRSHCRNCGHVLSWWENVPLVSWLALRGRCRNCRAWIGWRYPLVELAVGALWSYQAWQFLNAAFNPELPSLITYQSVVAALGRIIFYWLLVALAVLDAEHLWLPNWVTLPGAALGFAFTLLGAGYDSHSMPDVRLPSLPMAMMHEAGRSLLAICAAAGLILLIRWTFWLVRKQEGIGLGDAKLMAMLGAWLGLQGALLAFALAVLMGAAASLALLAVPAARRGAQHWTMTRLPLGTFLCIGGVASALWGRQIVTLYLRSMGLAGY